MKRTVQVTLRITFDDERQRTHPYYWDWSLLINQQGVLVDVVKTQDLEQPAQQPLSLETLTAPHLFALLFTAPTCEFVRPRSVHKCDSPIERVRILPHELGKFLAELDPTEQYFHVEFWAPHAEVWSAYAWRESLTRTLRHRNVSAAEDDAVALKHGVLGELISLIGKATRVSHDHAEKTAQAIIHFGDQYDVMLDLLKVSPELRANLAKLRKLIADQPQEQIQDDSQASKDS